MVTNYQRGRAFEYRVKKYFEDLGYFMGRSAGSKFPDLFGFNGHGDTILVECKTNRYITKEEKMEFEILRGKLPMTKLLVAYKKNHKIMFDSI